MTRATASVVTVWVAADTDRVMDVRWTERTTLIAQFSIGPTAVGQPEQSTAQFPDADRAAAIAAADRDESTIRGRHLLHGLAVALAVASLGLVVLCSARAAQARRVRRRTPAPQDVREPVGSGRLG